MTSSVTLSDMVLHCEKELLHLSGAIQGFGALLRMAWASGRLTHASANLGDFVDISGEAALGRRLADFRWPLDAALEFIRRDKGATRLLVNAIEGRHGWLDVHLVNDGEGVLVELQETTDARLGAAETYRLQSELIALPSSAEEMALGHERIVEMVRSLTGFDRVMVYRFHEDWSGEVIAEATTPEFGSYLGLRFPASDIPEIARNLYLQNPTRLIVDARAAPVSILSRGSSVPDLTWSDLRSVSPVHLEYLKHMGVASSFSIPVKVAGKLWGLIACHHLVPHYISPEYRQHCVSLVHTYSLTLSAYNANRRLQNIENTEHRISQVFEAIGAESDPRQGIDKHKELLLKLLEADGVALLAQGHLVVSGDVPEEETIIEIDRRFQTQNRDLIFFTEQLSALLPGAELGAVAGVLGIKTRSARSGLVRLYWFRNEEAQETSWAGNPNKPMVEDAGVLILSPRRSFEKWVEVKRGYSRAWSAEQRLIATKFRAALLRWL